MGRRKFSYRGKPHGRNELIKEYLWIAYLQSLPSGARPDETMMRTRKQVSSHIQVLKGFLKEHPACKILNLGDVCSTNFIQLTACSLQIKDPKMGSRIRSRMIRA